MNFKQNSLFTRNTGFDEEQADVQGGVLAVWGSPSSGKTTVSVKLADYLARKKKNVLLIFADMTTPPLPCICAAGDLEGEKSLGSILAVVRTTSFPSKSYIPKTPHSSRSLSAPISKSIRF